MAASSSGCLPPPPFPSPITQSHLYMPPRCEKYVLEFFRAVSLRRPLPRWTQNLWHVTLVCNLNSMASIRWLSSHGRSSLCSHTLLVRWHCFSATYHMRLKSLGRGGGSLHTYLLLVGSELPFRRVQCFTHIDGVQIAGVS